MSDLGTIFHIKMTKGENAGKQYNCHAYSSIEDILGGKLGEYIKIKFNGRNAYIQTSSEMSDKRTPMVVMKTGVPQYVLINDERTLFVNTGGNHTFKINVGNKIKKVAIYNAETGNLLGVAELKENSEYYFVFNKRSNGRISTLYNAYVAEIPDSANISISVKVSGIINQMTTTLKFVQQSD